MPILYKPVSPLPYNINAPACPHPFRGHCTLFGGLATTAKIMRIILSNIYIGVRIYKLKFGNHLWISSKDWWSYTIFCVGRVFLNFFTIYHPPQFSLLLD